MSLLSDSASTWAKDLVENGAEYMRMAETTEQIRAQQRMDALRVGAPPLSFGDHLYKDEQP
jgi:hypothetical protein